MSTPTPKQRYDARQHFKKEQRAMAERSFQERADQEAKDRDDVNVILGGVVAFFEGEATIKVIRDSLGDHHIRFVR